MIITDKTQKKKKKKLHNKISEHSKLNLITECSIWREHDNPGKTQ